MPFVNTVEFNYAFSGKPGAAPAPAGNLPSYYTVNSGFLMYQPGFTATTLQLKALADINTATVIRTYSSVVGSWTVIHDKDLDSNIWYSMPESGAPKTLYRYALAKGGTTITQTTVGTYAGATTSVLGACYAPACMWNGTAYGAFIIGGFNQSVVHVLPFTSSKTIGSTYTVPYTSEVYGTEMVPKQASGFNNHYGVAYTRGSKQMSSWTVIMDSNSSAGWTNRIDNSYTGGVNGPANGDGMIYYPPGKQIVSGDSATTTNRIAMNDTSSARLYVWTVAESGTQLNWTYLSTIAIANNGGYPYHMSSNTYNSVS
jgi:hypothetical protein